MKITIVGAGMMGSAMAIPALDNGHTVSLVGTPLDTAIIEGLKKDHYHITLKRKIEGDVSFYRFDEAESLVQNCDILICGVSSFGVSWFAESVLPMLKSGTPVLAITKGLHKKEDGSLQPFPVYFANLRPDVSFNAVGGPCISFELADRIYTQVAFCGPERTTLNMLRNAFATDYYNISVTEDICGIETAVALKNAYAMAVSLAIGLYTHNNPELAEKYNAQAGLFYEASREMEKIIEMLHGQKNALFFGVGDLYVTVFGGRTRKLGTILGAGIPFEQALEMLNGVTLESVAIIRVLGEYLSEQLSDFPLMQHIFTLITTGKPHDIPWNRFIFDY